MDTFAPGTEMLTVSRGSIRTEIHLIADANVMSLGTRLVLVKYSTRVVADLTESTDENISFSSNVTVATHKFQITAASAVFDHARGTVTFTGTTTTRRPANTGTVATEEGPILMDSAEGLVLQRPHRRVTLPKEEPASH